MTITRLVQFGTAAVVAAMFVTVAPAQSATSAVGIEKASLQQQLAGGHTGSGEADKPKKKKKKKKKDKKKKSAE